MDEGQATSIALLKINLSNLGKGCTGAMDATKASWGCPPALLTHLDKVSQEPEPGFACKLAEMN